MPSKNKPKVSLSIGGEKIVDDIGNMSPTEYAKAKNKVSQIAMKQSDTPDLFQWANQADANKQDMAVELYLFSKNYTVYETQFSKELMMHVRALFLYDVINGVQMGAATGLKVQDMRTSTEESNVVDFIHLESVPNAQVVIEQIAYGKDQLTMFSDEEHDMKRMKGMVAKFTPKGGKPFFIVKQLKQSNILPGAVSWDFTAGKFKKPDATSTIKVDGDTQVLVVGEIIYVFNVSKFTTLFNFDAKMDMLLTNKVREIEKHFKISMPEGVSLDYLARSSKEIAKKIINSDPTITTQEQLVDQSDEVGVALMTDDAGAIILMDKRDMSVFANLLCDDYVDSNMTGQHYISVKKKPMNIEDSQTSLKVM